MGSFFHPIPYENSKISQILVHPSFHARHAIRNSANPSASCDGSIFRIRNHRTSTNDPTCRSSADRSRWHITSCTQKRPRELQFTSNAQNPLVTRSSPSYTLGHPRRRSAGHMVDPGNIHSLRHRLGLLQN